MEKFYFFIIVALCASVSVNAQFIEESKTVGIDHFSNDLKQLSAGVAFFDYNNDGFQDIVLSGNINDSKIYENQGNSTFKDVTEKLGLLEVGDFRATGLITGDFDNDGFTDLFFTSEQGNRNYLFWNKNGTYFTDAGDIMPKDDSYYGTSCAVADYNLDGNLDLFVGNFKGQDIMYVNNGDGTFTPRSDLFYAPIGYGAALSVAFSDIDMDGDMDLLLGNEYIIDPQLPNRLFINNYPNDSFTEVSEAMNWALKISPMGVATGDYDEDGDFDYYVSDFTDNYLFENKDGLVLEEKAHALGVENDEGTSWGGAFLDYDNDTYLDLFVANGNIGITQFGVSQDKLFKGTGSGVFSDVSMSQGVANEYLGRGISTGDYNNDGKLDLLVGVMWFSGAALNNTHSLLYRNDNKNTGNWIKINLQGTTANRDAYGSKVEIAIGDRTLIRELSGGGTYMSNNSKVVHFGIGSNNSVDRLTIKWPGNTAADTYQDLESNKTYTAVQNGEVFEVEYKKLILLEGDSAFLGGEDRTESGIYNDTIPALTTSYRKIITTRLSFTDDDAEVDNGGENETEHSIARMWNELLLESIRNDYARPTVHARNLFHISTAMYDAFAVYDDEAKPYFLGNKVGGHNIPFNGITIPSDIDEARKEAISYACFRLLNHRFKNAPGYNSNLKQSYNKLMLDLGYDPSFTNTDYSTGNPATLGNYIGEQLIEFGLQDGSNEANNYENKFYVPKNEPLAVNEPGNPTITQPNNWQPLALDNFIDQSGNIIGANTPAFLSPEWGEVVPFALGADQLTKKRKNEQEYWVYHDPGSPGYIKTDGTLGLNDPYKWGFALVAVWSSHLDPTDREMIDISPASLGNLDVSNFPKTLGEYQKFYNLTKGGDPGKGYDINPITNKPYEPQIVPRGDYARVLAEFWADGPDSETPPGHWFSILNYVSDHPLTEKKFNGKGKVLSNLEWDVKSYMALGGAMHDAAVTAWGIKGYYDYIRPISAIRYMASKGQSSDTSLPNYSPEGIPLIPGYIEIVQNGDALSGDGNINAGKIKLYAWKGTHFIDNPNMDVAGVGWILAENWVPYQRPSFVTPPFAGYVSGHSTFSRAAAEVLTQLTGSRFFPGGMGVFDIKRNEFLVFEDGPSTDLTLQWASYQDASDQCSLSRIWGGIHPPIDDIAGRLAGEVIGKEAFSFSVIHFYEDKDGDGYYSYEDIDDNDSSINNSERKNKKVIYQLFPVPVNDDFTLKTESLSGRLRLKVYNIYGACVLSKQVDINFNESQISMERLSPGVYILIFLNEKGEKIISHKIIKS